MTKVRAMIAGFTALSALACGAGESAPELPAVEVPAVEAPNAAAEAPVPAPASLPDHTPQLTVTVTLDPAAEAELVKRGEGITVAFFMVDIPTDGGTTRDATAQLGSTGGTVVIPPVSMAPGPLGQPVNNWTVNVFSARKTDENNLLSCDAPGDVGTPPTEIVVHCKLI